MAIEIVSDDKITALQLAEEIKTFLQVSKVKQIEIALQEGTSRRYLLRIDLVKQSIEASSHLPEKVISALNQTFGESITIHVKPEKENERVFGKLNRNLLFQNKLIHSEPQKNTDKGDDDKNNFQSRSMKKF